MIFSIILLPLITFCIFYYRWYHLGRDPKTKNTVIPQYDLPDGITPLEAAAILYQKINNRDITAEIVKLAIEGYIRIEKVERKNYLHTVTDFAFIKLKNAKEGEASIPDQILMDRLFGVVDLKYLSSLKQNFFHTQVWSIRKRTHNLLVAKGIYVSNPEKIIESHTKNLFILCILAVYAALVWFSDGYISLNLLYLSVISILTSFAIVLVFAYAMPQKTQLGIDMKQHILGLKLYLKVSEEDRIKFHNAPQLTPVLFEKLLPMAIVFNMEIKWAESFKDIYTEIPNWYTGGSWKSSFNSFHVDNFDTTK